MKINEFPMWRRLIAGAFVTVFAALGATAGTAEDREALDAARKALDAAAARFAEIQSRIAARDMHAHGDRDRAFLGVLIGHTDEKGIQLVGVTPGSGAAEAGIEAGDVLVAIEGVSLESLDAPMSALGEALDGVSPGETVSVTVDRDGTRKDFDVETSGRRARMYSWHGDHDFDFDFDFSEMLDEPKFVEDFDVLIDGSHLGPKIMAFGNVMVGGLSLTQVGPELGAYFGVNEGVLVNRVPAESALKPGDILLEVGGEPVTDVSSAYRLLGRLQDPAEVTVRRHQVEQVVEVQPADKSRMLDLKEHMGELREKLRSHFGEHSVDLDHRVISLDESGDGNRRAVRIHIATDETP